MTKKAVSEKSLSVLNYLKETQDQNLTTQDIADALGLEKKSVEGIVTAGLQRKGYTERIPGEIELEDGSHKAIKIVRLTQAGVDYDHESALAEDEAEAKAAKDTE